MSALQTDAESNSGVQPLSRSTFTSKPEHVLILVGSFGAKWIDRITFIELIEDDVHFSGNNCIVHGL